MRRHTAGKLTEICPQAALVAARIDEHDAHVERSYRTAHVELPRVAAVEVIFYLVEPNAVVVVAIAHHRRRPGYWKKRLRRDAGG